MLNAHSAVYRIVSAKLLYLFTGACLEVLQAEV